MSSYDKYSPLREDLTEKVKSLQYRTLKDYEEVWLNYAQQLSEKGHLTDDEVLMLYRTFP